MPGKKANKKILISLFMCLIFYQSCTAIAYSADDSQNLKIIVEFMTDTPYSALIKHISVEVIPLPDDYPKDDYAEEKHIYKAQVLETYRGKKMKVINYTVLVEKGEEAIVYKKPFIITLCLSKEGFYWPGVGADFEASDDIIKLAQKVSKKLAATPTQKSFSGCD